MDGFLEFLSNNELIVVYYLLGAVVILLVAVITFDQVTKRKKRQELINQEFELYNTSIDDANYEDNVEYVESLEPEEPEMQVAADNILEQLNIEEVRKNIEHTQEIEEIKYVEEDEELERTQAQLELQALKEELNKMEEEPIVQEMVQASPEETQEPTLTVEEVIPILEETIDNLEEGQIDLSEMTTEDKIEQYESQQEEEAIISLDELEKASATITDEELMSYEDTGEEPISLQELEQLYKTTEEEVASEVEVVQNEQDNVTKVEMYDEFIATTKPAEEVYNSDGEFKSTPMISPVYGVETSPSNIALEQTANYDKLNDEIRKTNEFLVALKELRKNLD